MVHVSCKTVHGICQSYKHILDCLLCSHVQIVWYFYRIIDVDLLLLSSGYNTTIYNCKSVGLNVSTKYNLVWCLI